VAHSRRKPLTIFGDGTQTRDYVHVSDVADAIFRVGTGSLPPASSVNDRAFNIGTGVAVTVLEVAHGLLAAADADVPIEFAPARTGEQMHSWLAIDKARSRLGWEPRVLSPMGLPTPSMVRRGHCPLTRTCLRVSFLLAVPLQIQGVTRGTAMRLAVDANTSYASTRRHSRLACDALNLERNREKE